VIDRNKAYNIYGFGKHMAKNFLVEICLRGEGIIAPSVESDEPILVLDEGHRYCPLGSNCFADNMGRFAPHIYIPESSSCVAPLGELSFKDGDGADMSEGRHEYFIARSFAPIHIEFLPRDGKLTIDVNGDLGPIRDIFREAGFLDYVKVRADPIKTYTKRVKSAAGSKLYRGKEEVIGKLRELFSVYEVLK